MGSPSFVCAGRRGFRFRHSMGIYFYRVLFGPLLEVPISFQNYYVSAAILNLDRAKSNNLLLWSPFGSMDVLGKGSFYYEYVQDKVSFASPLTRLSAGFGHGALH